MTTKTRKPKYTVYNGFSIPLGFPVEGFASGLNYEAQPEDIFIATYPKCGTTWTQHIVWLIQHEGEPLSQEKSMTVMMPHLEEVGKKVVAALPTPRVIKTHLPFQMTPYHSDAKYIYVARNPFDCAVSFYHHTRGFVKHYDFAEGTFDEFFECFISGEVDWGDYFENLLSWYEHKEDSNVLFLTYEYMKADTKKAVIKIAEFLGTEYLNKVRDIEILNSVLYHSSFESMSKNQSRWSSPRQANMPPFIRKGQIGDWKNHFSLEQAKRLKEKFVIRTQGTGAENLWADIIQNL
ncbi:MAG: sulfotransferase domain-containing protein [Scytonema sp. PMC 1069.18]|nr:sulfotransferase domain-containing protein [Scytonema sp. PMC 1069.18]MEC4882437.1 sulfotransferase domain-containing protein [Scytonema sp. PMC 1070.18]